MTVASEADATMSSQPSSASQSLSSRPLHLLLVAAPGPFRSSLRVLLAALPGSVIVTVADNGKQALEQARRQTPGMLLVDFARHGHYTLALTIHLRALNPSACLIVLVDDVNQQRDCLVRADAVVVKGIRAAHLIDLIETLIVSSSPVTPAVHDVAAERPSGS